MTKPKTERALLGWGADWRERRYVPRGKWIKQIRVFQPVEPWGESITEFSERLEQICVDLGIHPSDAILDTEVEYGSYGDRDRDLFMVRGWRAATKAEIELKENEVAAETERHEKMLKDHEERQIAELKRTRPELFK